MTDIESILDRYNFKLARSNKHSVFKDENGNTFVLPKSPSDARWNRNAVGDLARIVGVPKNELLKPYTPKRRSRAPKALPEAPVPQAVMAEPVPAFPEPPPLSSADKKRLARWEKHDQQRRMRQDALIKRLPSLTCYYAGLLRGDKFYNYFTDKFGEEPTFGDVLDYMRHAMIYEEHLPCTVVSLLVEDVATGEVNESAMVSVSGVVLDIVEPGIHIEREWEWFKGTSRHTRVCVA